MYWSSCHSAPTPGRCPTTARCGDFWLLGFPPGPVRPASVNLHPPDSSGQSILTPSLVWTSSQHGSRSARTPGLRPSAEPDLRVAGLQETPRSQSNDVSKILFPIYQAKVHDSNTALAKTFLNVT